MAAHCCWKLIFIFLFNCPYKILFICFFFLFFYYPTCLKLTTLNKFTNSQLSQTLTSELSPLSLTVAVSTRTSMSPDPLKLNHSKQCVTALQQGLALRRQRTSQRLADPSCWGQYKQRSPTPWPHSDSGERDRETVRWAPRGFIVDLHLHLHRRSSSSWISGGVAVLVVICVMVFG